MLDFTSGYVVRAMDSFPQAGEAPSLARIPEFHYRFPESAAAPVERQGPAFSLASEV